MYCNMLSHRLNINSLNSSTNIDVFMGIFLLQKEHCWELVSMSLDKRGLWMFSMTLSSPHKTYIFVLIGENPC